MRGWHVAEYCWTAAHAFHRVGSLEAETFAAEILTAILHGHAARVADELTARADTEHLTGTKRDSIATCVRYLTGHLDQLRYDTALEAGWPIATGSVEGACRHLIGDRLDITGARWGLEGAEAVLNSVPSKPTATSAPTSPTTTPASTSAPTVPGQ